MPNFFLRRVKRVHSFTRREQKTHTQHWNESNRNEKTKLQTETNETSKADNNISTTQTISWRPLFLSSYSFYFYCVLYPLKAARSRFIKHYIHNHFTCLNTRNKLFNESQRNIHSYLYLSKWELQKKEHNITYRAKEWKKKSLNSSWLLNNWTTE